MPELPDVELFRKVVDNEALNQSISHVKVNSSKILNKTTNKSLSSTLTNTQFKKTRRRGKTLFIDVKKDKALQVHFGMTGYFTVRDDNQEDEKFDRAIFTFKDGKRLCYVSKRQLGSIALIDSIEKAIEELELGPDALEISESELDDLMASNTGSIKSFLMDQKKLSGVGNVYSDEILFQAQIHPNTPCKNLSKKDRSTIIKKMHKVLETAIKKEAQPGKMPKSFLLPHRKEGDSCPKCAGRIQKIKAAGRSSYVCPKCQPNPS